MSDRENKSLYDDGVVSLRQYQSERYGLEIRGVRLIFRYEETRAGCHTFLDSGEAVVGTARRSCLPITVSEYLDTISEPPLDRGRK